ncbi:MAG: hypothetical protein EPO24_03240 [Bacteroidetes bacterium]|nr:MAG: hypothetical protein EPO24_03240 [Bacteroidota bacterium]
MPRFQLPLALDPTVETLRQSSPDVDWLQERLRFYIFSGAINANYKPFPSIQEVWEWLFLMGTASRFRSILLDAQRRELEKKVLGEVNTWLEGHGMIENVALLGDEAGREPTGITFHEQDLMKLNEKNHANCIWFRAERRGYFFIFERVLKGGGMVGPWNIREDSYDIR